MKPKHNNLLVVKSEIYDVIFTLILLPENSPTLQYSWWHTGGDAQWTVYSKYTPRHCDIFLIYAQLNNNTVGEVAVFVNKLRKPSCNRITSLVDKFMIKRGIRREMLGILNNHIPKNLTLECDTYDTDIYSKYLTNAKCVHLMHCCGRQGKYEK